MLERSIFVNLPVLGKEIYIWRYKSCGKMWVKIFFIKKNFEKRNVSLKTRQPAYYKKNQKVQKKNQKPAQTGNIKKISAPEISLDAPIKIASGDCFAES